MLLLNLILSSVYLRAGPVRQAFPLTGQLRPQKPWDRVAQFGVMLYWPRAIGWLSLTADNPPSTPGAAGTAFATTPAGLDEVCALHAVDRNQFAPANFLEAHRFLAASVPRENRIVLTAEADTDAPAFQQFVQKNRDEQAGQVVLPVHVLLFDAKQFGRLFNQSGQIDLALRPCLPLPRYDGVLAVDLGNTLTTAATLPIASPVHRTDSIQLLPLQTAGTPHADVEPMPSVLRLDQINSASPVPAGVRRFPSLPGDDRMGAVAYAAGSLAAIGDAGELPEGVIYGAKQLLTVKEGDPNAPPAGRGQNPPPDQYLSLVIPHARGGGGPALPAKIDVHNRFPGELLLAHAVRRFREGASHWPSDLAVTYPTTYGPRELRQLERAVARGWLRAMGQPQDFAAAPEPTGDAELDQLAGQVRQWLAAPDPAGPPAGGLIGLSLDEATAAAFFHVHRRVFEQPGGLVRFRYLYPDGSRLLLIDCGGGTTDVVLVRARVPALNVLELDVMARTGLRAFGGDHITRAASRVLKAKLTLLAARLRNPAGVPAGLQPLPANGPAAADQAAKSVEDFIARVRQLDANDDLVPTRYGAKNMDASTQHRRAAAHALWEMADQVKRRLTDGRPVKVKDLGSRYTGKETSALVQAILAPLDPGRANQLAAQLGEVAVARWEVDALARPALHALVEKCNRLIGKHLAANGTGPEEEVDWVVVSGNGARYPLVREAVESGLHVAYLGDRLTFDTDNLKSAVAKGVAMARMVERVPRAVGVRFNRHLSELLPFDVGYHDLVTNQMPVLFAEYTSFTDLAGVARRVQVETSPATARPGNAFILYRRFPGDDQFTPYASYHFEQGIQGELEVRYDGGAGEFTATDTATGEAGRYSDLTNPLEYQSPVARGDV